MSLTKEQLALRSTGLSASDPAALMGLHPTRTQLDVWRDKCLPELADDEASDVMLLGEVLEPAVVEYYRRKTGALIDNPGTLVGSRPLMLATPDRIATLNGERRLVEVKTSQAFGARDAWGQEGTDEIPEHHKIQVQWTMAVAGLKRADVVALLSGRPAFFFVEYDPSYVDVLYEMGMVWWEKHVLSREPPKPDGSESWARYIKQKFPQNVGTTLEPATMDDVLWVNKYRRAQEAEKVAEQEKAEARQVLELRIGEAPGLEGPGWRLWWKNNKSSWKTDWEKVAAHFSPSEELIQECSKEVLGARPFVVREVKPKFHELPQGETNG